MITPESTREEVLTVLGRNGFALFAASNEIRGDKAVFRAAMEQLEVNLDVAEDASYRDIVLAAVTRNRDLLNLASDEMKADKKIFLAAIRQLGVNLDVAEDASYRDVVLAAVNKNGDLLNLASDEMKADQESCACCRKGKCRCAYICSKGVNNKQRFYYYCRTDRRIYY